MNFGRPRSLYIALSLSAAVAFPRFCNATTIPAPHDSRISSPTTSVLSDFNITNDGAPYGSRVYSGTANLNSNDLVIKPSPATAAAALAMLQKITDMVRSGYDFGDWKGTGITSALAANDAAGIGTTSLGFAAPGITAVGVILNDNGSGQPIWNTWDGVPVDQFSVLVKYTFYGDTTLKGYVDSSDVTRVTANLGAGTGWGRGEFRYTGGTVDSTDAALVTKARALESEYGVTVPEPTTMILILGAVAGWFISARRLRTPAGTGR